MLPEPVLPPLPPPPPIPEDVRDMLRFRDAAALVAHHTKMIRLYAAWLSEEREKLGAALGTLEEMLADAEASLTKPFAQAIEARSDETAQTGSTVGESAGRDSECAQPEPSA